MKTVTSDLLLSLAFYVTIVGIFALIVWIFISTWNRYKDKKRRKQTTLREAKEAEALAASKDDTLLREAQAFYDGI